jgi:hypothetical protein
MDPPWQTGGAQQEYANLKKATHGTGFPRPRILAKALRTSTPSKIWPDNRTCRSITLPSWTNASWQRSKSGAHHRLSHHPHDPEGPRDIAYSGDRLNTDPLRTFV